MNPHRVSTCDDYPNCQTEDGAPSDRHPNNLCTTPINNLEELKNDMLRVPIQ
jgi:hypothetical protein